MACISICTKSVFSEVFFYGGYMDIKQAIQAIKLLSELEFSDETVLIALDKAIYHIRCEALIQCDDKDIKEISNA